MYAGTCQPRSRTAFETSKTEKFPEAIAFGGGSVWVGLNGAPTVGQVVGPAYTVVRRIPVSANVYAIAATDHAVWAVHEDTDKVTRINY